MQITWHGYACFEISSGGYTLLLDPYRAGTLAGFPELDVTADEVLCSHGHDGHGAADAVKLRHSGAPSPFEVETMETGHDVLGGRLRGTNLVHIIRGEGMKIVHLGDLGCRLTPEQAELAADADALMIPIGGILTIEPYAAFELCRLLTPRLVLPMHYNVGGGSRRLRHSEEFTSLFEPGEVAYSNTNKLTLTAENDAGALVLMLKSPWGKL